MAEIESSTPIPRRPAYNRRRTSGKKSPQKVPDGASDKVQDPSLKQRLPKRANDEPKKRRAEARVPLQSLTNVNVQDRGQGRWRGKDAPDENHPDSDYRVKRQRPNGTNARYVPKPLILNTDSTYGSGIPSPAGTSFHRSPRTPSLSSLATRFGDKVTLLSQSSLQKAWDIVSDESTTRTKDPEGKVYKYVKTLGEGAYGTVILCTGQDGQRYALKAIKPVKRKSSDRKAREVRELQLLELFAKSKDCPESIIKYYGTTSYGGLPFEKEEQPRQSHIMEECQGPELAEILKRYKIEDPRAVRTITLQILRGLKFLKQNNIVHCDMKPENIMLKYEDYKAKNNYTIRLIDFGLSEQLESSEEKVRHVGGTPMYQPPELFQEMKSITDAVDIWAFGIILWEILHGLNTFPICPISAEKARRRVMQKKGLGEEALDDDRLRREIADEGYRYFKRYNDAEFKKKINFDTKEWQRIPQVIPLAEKLLNKNYKERISASDALKEPWLTDDDT